MESGTLLSDFESPSRGYPVNGSLEQKQGLEKSDSCYDSDVEHDVDCENSGNYGDLAGHVVRGVHSANSWHRDVSRTVSETLKEECDYPATGSATLLKTAASQFPEELLKLHLSFALKLGYTENQVRRATAKLGPLLTQNELLAELICLGASDVGHSSTDCQEQEKATEDDKVNFRRSSPDALQVRGIPQPQDSGATSRSFGTTSTNSSNSGGNGAGDLVNLTHAAKSLANLSQQQDSSLRHVVIDGSNVAMSHGNKVVFSCRGIELCVDFFRQRGHKEITVFVPLWRKESSKPDAPIKDQEILLQLEHEKMLTFTPSRYVGNRRRLVCYDDRYIIKLAMETDGIIVSNDTYRDLIQENIDYRKVVEERLLMYSFVNDRFMPPDDPLGRHGPTLKQFLRKTSSKQQECQSRSCPYGKKCTYGNKCKFAHPERGNQPQKSVTEIIGERAKIQLQQLEERDKSQTAKCKLTATLSSPVPRSPTYKQVLRKTSSVNPNGADAFALPPPPSSPSFFSPANHYLAVPSPTSAYRPPSGAEHHNSSHVTGGGGGSSFDQIFTQGRSSPHHHHHQNQGQYHFSNNNKHLDDLQRQHHLIQQQHSHSLMPDLGGSGHQSLSQTLSDGYITNRNHNDNNNMHNKLQRQLSLNPYAAEQLHPGTSAALFGRDTAQQRSSALSSPRFFPSDEQDLFRGLRSEKCNNNISDSFFTTEPTPHFFTSPRTHCSSISEQMASSSFSPSAPIASPRERSMEAQRSELFSRLSTLFPEEQVRTVMTCYPHECSLHKLCSALLTMFPDERQ